MSVVIPAYNNDAYIRKTLESVLAQTYPSIELIVADHSSSDRTLEEVSRFTSDPRVTVLTTPGGGGALRNWNRVSSAATGKYVKLVCGDDLLRSDIVARQVEGLEANPSASLAASQRSIVDANDKAIVRARGLAGLHGLVPGKEAVRRTVRAGANIFGEPACVMIRRSALEEVGYWDSRYPYLIDEATYVRVLLTGDLFALAEPMASFRVSHTQWSVRLVKEQAEQASAFHKWLGKEHPEVVSPGDVRRGNAQARRTAQLRRLAYTLLKRRMGAAQGPGPQKAGVAR
ncbi:glycosyltransferase family 2 protein [Rathayibacter sp. KR2-224]|uniref:glycosyltransferase family 2 protein n=1 Tax=Rathayibacter sp. KR2-224 TaxID=3400913 RepID=UPI003C0195CC